MAKPSPKKIKINHDDYHAEFVGRTADERQFFLTNPFVPALGNNPGREFLALYTFDADGNLLEAKIDDLGVREINSPPGNKLDLDFAASLVQTLLAELGKISFRDIKIAPFRVERFGIEFGLITQPPEEPNGDWCFTVEPGNYMAFFPPYDGEYYT